MAAKAISKKLSHLGIAAVDLVQNAIPKKLSNLRIAVVDLVQNGGKNDPE
jgi:hypothetical protein